MGGRVIRACLIINPKSGKGGVDLSEAYAVLQGHGWEVTVRRKMHGGHATELAREAAREGYNVVVDCGGDGTLSEIVEGVVGTDVAVGTLPGGTANLWAHEVGISQKLGVAALQLVGAERRRVDVGIVSVNGKHHHHFVLMAGIGMDAAVLNHISKPLKNRVGMLAYAPAVARALPEIHAVPVRVEMDDIHWQGKVSEVIVGNTRRYAAFTQTTPDAFIDDGMLDVCLVTAQGPISTTRQLGSLLLRQRPSPASAQLYRAATITVYAPTVLPLQSDGGTINLDDDDLTADGVIYRFSVLAQGVTMLIPKTYDGLLFQPSRVADTLSDIGVQPVPVDKAKHNGNGHDTAKEKHWKLRVLSVGADSITAARLKNGKVVRVLVDPQTTLEDGTGTDLPLWGALSTLSEGDRVEVYGQKGDEPGTLMAHKVAAAKMTAAGKS